MTNKLKAKIGVSAIAWLNDDMPELTAHISLEDALSDMQKIGFSGTENGGAFPNTSYELAQVLGKYNLELVSGWYSGKLLERSFVAEKKVINSQLRLFKDLDAKVIVYGETSGADLTKPLIHKPMVDDFKKYAKKVEDLAKYCNDFGVPLALHHHMGTAIENMQELNQLMDLTQELNIVFDTGHCLMSGGNPTQACKQYAFRITHFHLKDIRKENLSSVNFTNESFMDAVTKGSFTVPSDGYIDFNALVEILYKANYQGWFVIEAEQDPHKANPFVYSQMGYQYVKELLEKYDYQIN